MITLYLNISSFIIIDMCLQIITSTIRLRKADAAKSKTNFALIFTVLFSLIFIVFRNLILTRVFLYSGNVFCFPFIIDNFTKLSSYHLVTEFLFFVLHLVILLLTIIGLSAVLVLVLQAARRVNQSQKVSKSKKATIATLCLFILLKLCSKMPLLILQMLFFFRVVITPNVYTWTMALSISIWPICHPCVQIAKMRK